MTAIRLKRSLLLAGALLLALSCSDAAPPVGLAPTGAPPRDDLIGGILHIGLLKCDPLPADEVTRTIGPDGGTIHVGPHKLFIPAGALAEPTTITAIAPSDTVNSVVFFPEGLVFAQPAKLTMSYANCFGLGTALPKRIAHTSPNLLVILEYLLSIDNLFARKVSAQLPHFSTYAV